MAKDSDSLSDLALAAARAAYSPYSGICIGAAVEAVDGSRHVGCNVENASYGLTICAERAAVCAAAVAGQRRLRRVAVCFDPVQGVAPERFAPCGACLQVLSEFATPDMTVEIAGAGTFTLDELMPRRFKI